MSVSSMLGPVAPIPYQEFGLLGKSLFITKCLGMGLLGAVALAGVLGYQLVKMSRVVAAQQPMVVRVSEVGQAEAVDLRRAAYTPQDVEMKYFLPQFARKFWSRDRRTLVKEYPTAGYFLTPAMFAEIQTQDAHSQWAKKFLASTEDNVEIEVKNVSLDESSKPKYSARLEFDKRYVSTGGAESKVEHWTAVLYFTVDPGLALRDTSMIPYNPLGFQIYYLRADPAFN